MRDAQISLATMQVVSKFGLKKTTMADIADAAGISRQTLYNAYPNKEAVIQAATKFVILQDLEDVKAAWADTTSLAQKLDVFFQHGPIAWYERINAMPDAAELLEGISKLAEPALEEAHKDWIAALEHQLAQDMDANKANGLADFVFATAKNAKYSAKDRDHLLAHLAILKDMVLKTYL